MYIAGSILVFVSLAALAIGLILGIFKKGKRKLGRITVLVSVFLGVPVGTAMFANDPNLPTKYRTADDAEQIDERDEAPSSNLSQAEVVSADKEDETPLEVDEQADPRMEAMIAKVHRMAEDIVLTLNEEYDLAPVGMTKGGQLCREDNFCDMAVGDFSIVTSGAGIAYVQGWIDDQFDIYRELCAATFSAISGTDLDFSAATLEGAFQAAAIGGDVKMELNNVEIKIQESVSGQLNCRFFKYGN